MLLPSKGVSSGRALLTVGSELLPLLGDPVSVTGLWERFKDQRMRMSSHEKVTFDWFALAVTLLFTMGLIERAADGTLRRVTGVSSQS